MLNERFEVKFIIKFDSNKGKIINGSYSYIMDT